MGNLENDDIEETASLKTITSDINSNETNPHNNSIKSGKLEIKDEISKKRSSIIKNGEPMLVVSSKDENLENGDVGLVNRISNGVGDVPPENEGVIAKSPNVDKIDTNAEVHAEHDSYKIKALTKIPRSNPKNNDQDGTVTTSEIKEKSSKAKETEDVKPATVVNGSELKTYTNEEINGDESEDVIPDVNNDIIIKSNNDNISISPRKEESVSNQMSDSNDEAAVKNKNHSASEHNVEDKATSETVLEKSNETITESGDMTNTKDPNIETQEQPALSKPDTFHGEKGSTPILQKRPFKRSVSDNFLIKSTSTNTSPIDSTYVYHIELDDALLIQNNINSYKSEEALRSLTKLELIKRSISETLEGLKSKLMRNNRVNGTDRNVKLITVESSGRNEDEMLENIRTPHEMKSASLESVVDAAPNDSEDTWHTERDVNKGVDVLRRDGSPGNGQPMADPSAPDVVATNDPKNGIVNPAFTPPSLLSQQSTVWSRKQQAVCVRHAFKHYGSKSNPNHVLSNLNMTVAKGTIYGLLGASGCGKTTLLSCIVGRRRLNTGEIWVLGGKPGTKGSGVPGKRVGYMPQEIALYGEFSIKETMMYFGWIFGMETPEIDDRLQFLLNFLDLPSQSRLVKNLSGGQQRRVSFAVALMHDPELLILDEPTVGVDPLLRQSIWNHLVQITKDGNKTVIITTHYIEEARQAHTIGLMRSGRLLAEESPHVLLQTYGCQSLEEVFLKLSRKQGNDAAANNVPEVNISNNITLATLQWGNKTDEPVYVTEESGVVGLMFNQSKEILIQDHANGHFDPNGKSAMMIEDQEDNANCGDCCPLTTKGKTKALLQKNFLRMWRNVGVMLFIFALPVMQVILFCLAIGRDPTGLHLAIVNQEMDWATKACPVLSNCSFTHLSCRYLNSLPNDTIIKDYYPDPESAINAVRVGDAWGALYFTDNFTDALVARMVLGRDADEETLDQSEIRVWLDMSNQQIGLMLNRDLQLSYRDFAQNLLSTCDQNPKIADIPIQFKEPIYGSNDPSFTDFVAPGVILTIVFFLAVALTSSALIIERMEGLLDRSWVAGVTPLEILFSHVITQFVVMCGQTALVLIFMIFVFGVECKGDLLLVIILTILQGLCGMCFGFVISAICELERNAIQLALGSFYPTLLLSGVIWPVEGMPVILRYISLCLPLTMATTSLRSILTRGWNLVEPDVYLGFISTITWIVLFLTISMLVLKFKRG